MRPWLLRPPFLGSGRVSDFSGVVRVISTKSASEEPRRPGVVGLYLRIAMFFSPQSGARSGDRTSEDVDAVALGEADDRALGVRTLAEAVDRVDRRDLDVEHLLDRDLDLGLVGVRTHDEGVLVRVEQAVALLGHDRCDQDVAVVLVQGAHFEPSLAVPDTNTSYAPLVKTMSSEASTSYVLSWSTATMCTSGALRSDSQVRASLRSRTTRNRVRSDSPDRPARADLVEGLSPENSDSTTWMRSL